MSVSGQPPPEFNPTIAEFYRQAPEEDRLEQDAFALEGLRTRELIERHARRPPATVLDVGGAAGVYALWLADAGYTVHLVDPVPRLVAEAERRSAGRPRPLASCRVGDARALDFPDQSADMVLLLGPLYHQTEAVDRARWTASPVTSIWIRALPPSLSETSGRDNIAIRPSGSTTSLRRTFIARTSFGRRWWARV
jgi:SAM-dependent methyltransferase